ncbi:VOC family protein [Sphingomonas sp. RS6]
MSVQSPRLITVTMPANGGGGSKQLAEFYDSVFALGFGRTIKDSNAAYQTWISAGVKVNIGERYHDSETTMLHLAVPSLATFREKVAKAGGKIMTDPISLEYHSEFVENYQEKFEQFKFGRREDVTPTLGSFQICCDPQGNRFGIVELEPWAARLFEHGEISKIEIAEQRASLEHAARLEALETG